MSEDLSNFRQKRWNFKYGGEIVLQNKNAILWFEQYDIVNIE